MKTKIPFIVSIFVLVVILSSCGLTDMKSRDMLALSTGQNEETELVAQNTVFTEVDETNATFVAESLPDASVTELSEASSSETATNETEKSLPVNVELEENVEESDELRLSDSGNEETSDLVSSEAEIENNTQQYNSNENTLVITDSVDENLQTLNTLKTNPVASQKVAEQTVGIELNSQDNVLISNYDDLSDLQKNALATHDFIMDLTNRINKHHNNKLFLEEMKETIYGNINKKYIGDSDGVIFVQLLNAINQFQLDQTKRERLQYLCETEKANVIHTVIPNPLGLLSSINSDSIIKGLVSAVYMTIDSIDSYKNAVSEIELKYLQDNWTLADDETETFNTNLTNAFQFELKSYGDYGYDPNLALDSPDIENFYQIKTEGSGRRIDRLTQNQDVYQYWGPYWLLLAQSYYERENYKECLNAIDRYESFVYDIYTKDYTYAETLPYAIGAAKAILDDVQYVEKAQEWANEIYKNTEVNEKRNDWALRYFAAQTYIDLYSVSNNILFLKRAWNTIRDNISFLASKQDAVNEAYFSPVVTRDIPSSETKETKKKIEAYNNQIIEDRKVQLPEIYEPLYVSCDLLYSLASRLNISKEEKANIDEILRPDGNPSILVSPIDELFSFSARTDEKGSIEFDGKTLSIPAQYMTDSSKVEVIITPISGEPQVKLLDWEVTEVLRGTEGDISTFFAKLKNSGTKYSYKSGDKVMVVVDTLPDSGARVLEYSLRVEKENFFSPLEFIEIK